MKMTEDVNWIAPKLLETPRKCQEMTCNNHEALQNASKYTWATTKHTQAIQ